MQKPKGPRIPPEFLSQVKGALNLIEIVSEHVVLRKSGANYTGLCPFHSERSPSFSVSEQKQLYHCYGCKKGGDLLTFFMEIHGLSFTEAVEELAERARLPLPAEVTAALQLSNDPAERARQLENKQKLELAYRLNRFAAAFYHGQLKHQTTIRKYFENRGVDAEWQKTFYVGATPEGWEGLARFLVEKKAPMELAQQLGLVRASTKKPGQYFDLFRNRALFPILDLRGRVAGFGGRLMEEARAAKEDAKDAPPSPKYLNSPESPTYQKSRIAFGLFQAQKHIREADEAILVEGYFDVLALHAAGFKNTVAVSGTSLSAEHLNQLRRLASKITLLFDGDRAGRDAVERCLELGLDQGLILYSANLPDGLDPDELVMTADGKPNPEGIARLQSLLTSARPILDEQIDHACLAAQKDPEAKAQALRMISAWLARLKDPAGREVRLEMISAKLGMNRDVLLRALGIRGEGPLRPVAALSRAPRPEAPARLSALEKTILTGWLSGGLPAATAHEIRQKLPPGLTISDLFDYPPARDFVALLTERPEVLASLQKDPGAASRLLSASGLQDSELQSIVTAAAMQEPGEVHGGEPVNSAGDFNRAIDQRLKRVWARFSQRLRKALQDAEAKKDAGLHASLMQEYLDVQRRIKEFSPSL